MSSSEDPCPEHPGCTGRRNLKYCFSRAHHGRGTTDDSQWKEDLSEFEEFSIFDLADHHDLSDPKGHLYGIRPGPAPQTVLDLGTEGEQVAKFWKTREGQPWHGFPLWPLGNDAPDNRNRTPAPRAALRRMVEVGLLLPEQRKRLQKGDRI